ncbi:MAG: LPS export ABC transporter permease LptF [Gammaproteobacteria bacterium]|nr:LPS export ABC transporter permease LptF [Gammaproteobacteria bacterium]
MTVAYRYIIKELIIVLGTVFVLLMLVSVAARFTGYLQEAAAGKFTGEVLWTLMSLRLPEFVQLALPFSLVIAVIVTFGRLHADQEFVVLVMGGTSILRLVGWLCSVVVPIAIFVGILSLVVTPASRQTFVDMLANIAVSHEFDLVRPGEFRNFSNDTRTIYVDEVDRDARILHGVFLFEAGDTTDITVIAQSATFLIDADTGHRLLQLQDGVRYEGTPGLTNYRILSFEELSLRLDLSQQLDIPIEVEALPTASLDRSIGEHAQQLDWRISLPIMTFVSGLLAFALSRTRPRSGRFGQVIPGVLAFVCYYLLLVLVQQGLSDSNRFSSGILYSCHVLVFATAATLIHRQLKPR